MAKIGLNSFRYGILTEDAQGNATYGGALTPAKAISCNVSITNNEAKLYADDVVAESDTSFAEGTVTIGIDEDNDAMMANMLGHAYDDGTIIRSSYDVAPYVGFGRIIVKMVNGQYKYKVEFLKKVKFAEPSQENQTKGENVEFGTSEMEGQIMALADGSWSIGRTFNTKADALTFLEGLLGTPTAATVTFNVNGGSGSYDAVSTYVGSVISLPDGSALTPPTNKVFAGWDTTSSATHADYHEAFVVTAASVTLYAVWTAV